MKIYILVFVMLHKTIFAINSTEKINSFYEDMSKYFIIEEDFDKGLLKLTSNDLGLLNTISVQQENEGTALIIELATSANDIITKISDALMRRGLSVSFDNNSFLSNEPASFPEFISVFVQFKLISMDIAEDILFRIYAPNRDKKENRCLLIKNRMRIKSSIINETNYFYPQSRIAGTFSRDIALGVHQHFYAYSDDKNDKHILASGNAESCVIIAVYNPRTKRAAMAHIDTHTTEVDNWVNNVSTNLKENEQDVLEIHLAGGNDSSLTMILNLLQLIESNANWQIKTANLLPPNSPLELAIDTKTGEIYTVFEPIQIYWPRVSLFSIKIEGPLRSYRFNRDILPQ